MGAGSRKLLAGALGGALGSVAMKAVVHFWDPDAFGLSSQTDARAARALLGDDLEQKFAERLGSSLHYAFGILTGIAYAAAIGSYPALRTARGVPFGAGLWLLGDELAVSLTHLETASAAKAGSHVSALAAHLLYGAIVDACYGKAT
ncbi:MAG: DUF6789 family protein [Bryobacteraceae bacterium]